MAASKTLADGLKDQVTCSICLEQFTDPRVLIPCLHTYCKHCLEGWVNKGERTCPLCKSKFTVDNVDSLKVNFWANETISLLALSKVDSKEQNGGGAEVMCDNCVKREPARVRCFDCEKFMCDTCLAAHKLMLSLKDHHVMTIEEIKHKGFPVVEKLTFCKKHKGKKQKLYCKECEHLICKDCTVFDHKGRDYRFIVDIIDYYKEKLKSGIETARNTMDNLKDFKSSLEKRENSVITNGNETEKRIDEIINKQIQALEQKRKCLKETLNDMIDAKLSKVTSQKSELEVHQVCLKSAIEFAENTLAKGSNSEIFSVSKDVTSRLSQLSTKPFEGESTLDSSTLVRLREDDEAQKALSQVIEKLARIAEVNLVAVDHQKCEVVFRRQWGKDFSYRLYIRNADGELIDINKDRISLVCGKNALKYVIQRDQGFWLLHIFDSGHFRPPKLNILVDGKPIKNSDKEN